MSLHEIILTVSSNAPSPFQLNKQTLVSLHLLDTKDCTGKTRLDKKQNSSEDKLSKKPKCYDTEAAGSGTLICWLTNWLPLLPPRGALAAGII